MKKDLKKKISLNLNKQTIAYLNNNELNFARGGSNANQSGGDQTQLGSVQEDSTITSGYTPIPTIKLNLTKEECPVNPRITIV